MMRSSRHREGFSLLELMLVLVVMAGVMALVGPAMMRSLASNEIRDAARQLREQLMEARHEAMDTGQPVLVRLSPGGRFVRMAGWREAMENPETLADPLMSPASSLERASSDSNGTSGPPRTSAESAKEQIAVELGQGDGIEGGAAKRSSRASAPWELPGEIVISRFSRSGRSIPSKADELIDPSGSTRSSPDSASSSRDSKRSERPSNGSLASRDQRDPPILSDETSESEGLVTGGWLWYLPHGQGPAAEITLFDPASDREIVLRLDGWTGAIEIDADQRRERAMADEEVSLEP